MYRKGISALIVNAKNDFLLVNLISFEEKYYAIPGGGVEANETLEDASYREIKEELGINSSSLELIGTSPNPLQFIFKVPKINKEGKEYIGSERYFFAFRFIGSDDEIQLAKDEVRAYKWVPFSALNQYLLFDNQLADTIEKIKEIFG
ncbi:NUDIX domain-containing protein [Candidatus Gracilibacteria bacterium]|nr:NUDIX domain-containing protein [Candidatus Gracilibacteria bacterium]